MSNASSIQRFVPRLVAELEVLDLPDGDSAVCARDVHYARLSPSDRRLFAHMDGERDLAAIVRDASESGKLVSIRQLLAVVKRLAEAGALDNATGELESYELLPKPPSLARRLGRGLLTTRLEVGALGRGLGWALGWMRGVRLSATGWASYILVGATICAYLRWKSPSVVDPLRVGSSYALGLVLVYAGVAAALTAREVAKLLVLVGYGVRVQAAGLTARLGLLWAPSVDARHIIRAGRGGERELAAAGLAGPVLILTAIIVRWKVAFMPAWLSGLQVMAWGAAVVCWANACPLLPTDLGRLIDAMRDDSQGRRHALAYMSQRLLRRQGKSEFFEGESALVAVALAAVAWLYAGFLLGTSASRPSCQRCATPSTRT